MHSPSCAILPRSTRFTRFVFIFGISLICAHLDTQTSARYQTSQQFTGHENHSISLSDATTLTRNFRATAPSNAVLCEFFGRDAVLGILNQTSAVGLRIYYGKKDDGTPVLVLVGVTAEGQDLTGGPLAEIGYPCPPICPGGSVLNQ